MFIPGDKQKRTDRQTESLTKRFIYVDVLHFPYLSESDCFLGSTMLITVPLSLSSNCSSGIADLNVSILTPIFLDTGFGGIAGFVPLMDEVIFFWLWWVKNGSNSKRGLYRICDARQLWWHSLLIFYLVLFSTHTWVYKLPGGETLLGNFAALELESPFQIWLHDDHAAAHNSLAHYWAAHKTTLTRITHSVHTKHGTHWAVHKEQWEEVDSGYLSKNFALQCIW